MTRFVIMLFVSDVRSTPELRLDRNDYEDPGDSASVNVKRAKDLDDYTYDRNLLLLLHRLYSLIGSEGDTKTERVYVGKRFNRLRQLYSKIGKPVVPQTQRVFVGKRKSKTYATTFDRTPNDFASLGAQRASCCSDERLPLADDIKGT